VEECCIIYAVIVQSKVWRYGVEWLQGTFFPISTNKEWLYVLLEYGCIMRLTMAENLLHNCCLKVPRHGCGKQGQAWCICTFLTIQVTKYRFTCAA
jgi:hypothetical protein